MSISVKHVLILAVVMRVSTMAYASSLVELSPTAALSGTNADLVLSGTRVAAADPGYFGRGGPGTMVDSEISGVTTDLATYVENGYGGQSIPTMSRWTWPPPSPNRRHLRCSAPGC